jgi:hypothetical protein
VRARRITALALLCLGAAQAGAQRAPRAHTVPPPVAAPVAAPVVAPVEAPVAAPAPDSGIVSLSVTLITFGPGEEVWERFGHNALWIHDENAGTDIAYNWGLFDFDQPDFLQRFLSGDTKYWMAGEDAYRMIAAYHDIGRPITLQRLNLTQAQAATLRDFVEWNALEENKYYRYDYFRDNCSTRLRDAIDRALDGALRRATDSVHTALTYRGESVRLTSGILPVQAGIDVALGRPADRPLTEWQSFFIPMRLRDALQHVTVPAADGSPVALVSDRRVIAPTSGVPVTVPEEPPSLVLRYLLLGVLLTALVVALRYLMVSRRGAAWGLALFGMLWSLAGGIIGTLLLYMWLFTRHVFWAWNENLLLLSPLALLLVVFLPAALLRSRAVRRTRVITFILAMLGVLALLLALLPGGQANLAIVALVLPVQLALAWALTLPLPERVIESRTA